MIRYGKEPPMGFKLNISNNPTFHPGHTVLYILSFNLKSKMLEVNLDDRGQGCD